MRDERQEGRIQSSNQRIAAELWRPGASPERAPRAACNTRGLLANGLHVVSLVIKRLALALPALVLACASALAQTAAAPAATNPRDEARAGTLKSVRGNVRVLGLDDSSRPASPGDGLAPIDRLVTGPDSGASVVLRDGTRIVVGPSSRLDLKEFHFDSTTQDGGILVSLLRGSLRMVTGLIGKTNPDAVRVETPTAVIGIRGTDFIVQADPQP